MGTKGNLKHVADTTGSRLWPASIRWMQGILQYKATGT